MKSFFVTGIDTDSGKTLASAILCEALNADYWKPVQAGQPRDTETVQSLVTNSASKFHKETFLLTTPASPHASAKIDRIAMRLSDFSLPPTENPIIVEGAGGCLVPLNDENFMTDLIIKLNLPVILVADLYLGSINHTLLTIEALERRNILIEGIIFNGEPNKDSEDIILSKSKLPCLLRINREKELTKNVVRHYAKEIMLTWKTI